MAKASRYALKDIVSVETYSGDAGRGPRFGAARQVRAQVQYKRQVIVDEEGQDVVSELTIITDGKEDITVQSRITYDGKTSRAVQVHQHKDRGLPVLLEVITA